MLNKPSLHRFGLAAVLALLLPSCAGKQARFDRLVVAKKDPQRVFQATEKVLKQYFNGLKARRPQEGLMTTEKIHLREGDSSEDAYRAFATALVSYDSGHCQVQFKVQRTKVRGRWSWCGLGTNYREQEALAGTDAPLTRRIRGELMAALVQLPDTTQP